MEALKARVVFEPDFRSPEAVRGAGGVFPHLADLAVFPGGGEGLVAHGAPAPARRQRPDGSLLPPDHHSAPTPSGCPPCGWTGWSPIPPQGPVLHVAGADLMDGTPIFDIKPYLPYGDCRPEATGGFAPGADRLLEVEFPERWLSLLPEDRRQAAAGVLAQDPGPPIRGTRSGSTAWSSPAGRSVSRCGESG